jgi:dienelactone hydrolase
MYFYGSMSEKNIIRRIIASPTVQTFLIYLSGGWIALEMTDYFISKYELNERISEVLSIILLIGMPVVLFLAWYLSREKEERITKSPDSDIHKKPQGVISYLNRKLWFTIPVTIVLLLLILTGVRLIHKQVKIKWAREEAIPQMERLLNDQQFVNAYQVRQQAKKYIPDDPEFLNLDSQITTRFSILTDPEGVDVYYKEYPDVQGEWNFLGKSPIQNIEMPDMTMYRWKLEKAEYENVLAVLPTSADTLFRKMHEIGKIPDGMVYVEGINQQTSIDFFSKDKHGFFIDRYEVSNKEYKKFIDHGGYQDPSFWQNDFILNNEKLSFGEAMDQFRDATGRPGPATWEAGDYPDGQDDYPVNGISWYEAAAYALSAGKSLPTISHWRSTAGFEIRSYRFFLGPNLIPLSNMKGIGPEPVGNNAGINCFGTSDMSGNVREWCWNEAPAGRLIQGGAWNDASYMAIDYSQLPAFDRSEKNGFRCALYPDVEQIPEEVFLPFEMQLQRDHRSEEPASEVEFQIFKKQFMYDYKDLNSVVENRNETPADWIIEKVSFDAAYEQERVIAYLFLPKEVVQPFQTIILFPGSGAMNSNSIFDNNWDIQSLSYLINNGRAVMYPIYKGTYERRDGYCNPRPSYESHQYTECLIKQIKDLRRSIDYLETREDIDTSSLCYIGDSWGGRLGSIIPAVEERIKLNVLLRGGFSSENKFPEVDEINYVSHVKSPVLMLNGRYDFVFPFESTVKPMFDLWGTPEKDKKLVLYDTDHFIPKTEMIKEVLDWLDKNFGPVKR